MEFQSKEKGQKKPKITQPPRDKFSFKSLLPLADTAFGRHELRHSVFKGPTCNIRTDRP